MTETRNEYRPVAYGVLEPGLQAAMDLLERESRNEVSAGEVADAQDRATDAQTHAVNAMGYRKALDLLREQREVFRGLAKRALNAEDPNAHRG